MVDKSLGDVRNRVPAPDQAEERVVLLTGKTRAGTKPLRESPPFFEDRSTDDHVGPHPTPPKFARSNHPSVSRLIRKGSSPTSSPPIEA